MNILDVPNGTHVSIRLKSDYDLTQYIGIVTGRVQYDLARQTDPNVIVVDLEIRKTEAGIPPIEGQEFYAVTLNSGVTRMFSRNWIDTTKSKVVDVGSKTVLTILGAAPNDIAQIVDTIENAGFVCYEDNAAL